LSAPLLQRLTQDARTLGSRPPCIEWTIHILDRLEILGIAGDFVECGVWQGAQPITAKAYIEANGYRARRYWLFDTFSGMPPPGPEDVNHRGGRPLNKPNDWLLCSRADVERAFSDRELLDDSVIFVEGMVEQTLRTHEIPDRISYLRLDTDFYSSTMVELQVLYPMLVRGGALVIDDYGWWLGAKKAVDTYFGGQMPEMVEIDRSARLIWKP
jgi:O-methyltransferase